MNSHVALLLPDLRAGGAQRVFLMLAREFLKKGAQVDIVVGLNEGDLQREVPSGARLISLTTRAPVFGRFGLALIMLLRLVQYLNKYSPEALLSTLSGTNLVAAAAKRMARKPIRLVLREACQFKNINYGYYISLMRYSYRWADAIVALTPEMRTELEDILNLQPDKIVQIANPVDMERLQYFAAKPLPEDFSKEKSYILAVGRLEPQKDYPMLIRAFSEVARQTNEYLVILGEGRERQMIESLIRELSLQNRVVLYGFDANPYRWMAHASLFVLSSRWEGYPNVILEAQALNVPVVSTEYVPSARSLVLSPGMTVPVGDYLAMSDAIIKVLANINSENYTLNNHRSGIEHSIKSVNVSTEEAINRYVELLLPDAT